MVDKDLFLHDLSIVAILKNEGHYLKEWLDYHLLAGVDHFYLYDNESPDNQAEVAAPYVEAGLVDYFSLPGPKKQLVAYKTAINKFKFQSRYMAFVDGDEFIYPKSNRSISEVLDEILSQDKNAAGVFINWQIFGSNGQEKADYSRGVLERFTRRAPRDEGRNHIGKTIANPRKIEKYAHPHYPVYFDGAYSINESGGVVEKFSNKPVTADKIALHHYYLKSKEEAEKKFNVFSPCNGRDKREIKDRRMVTEDRNEEFDDSILAYRDARAKVYQPPDNSHVEERLLSALKRNLSTDSYAGKLETFLTCRAVAEYLKQPTYEEAALKAIVNSLQRRFSFADAGLLVKELPEIWKSLYPVIEAKF